MLTTRRTYLSHNKIHPKTKPYKALDSMHELRNHLHCIGLVNGVAITLVVDIYLIVTSFLFMAFRIK